MTKNQVAQMIKETNPDKFIKLAAMLGKSEEETRSLYEAFCGAVSDSLAKGQKVFVPGMGNWETVKESEEIKKGDDGKTYLMPPKISAIFNPSSKTIKIASHEL